MSEESRVAESRKSGVNVPYLFYLGLTAALGGLLFGFDIAIITGAGPFLTQHFRLNEMSMGIAFSSLLFGCALGSLIAGFLADHFGRRGPLLWVAVLFALTSVGTGLAPDFNSLLLFRFLGGIAVGGASILAPMYVAEVSPPQFRGRMCACYQWAITTGILVSFLLNYLLREIVVANRWINRLLGELQSDPLPPAMQRNPFKKKETPLVEAGLIGPVKLSAGER